MSTGIGHDIDQVKNLAKDLGVELEIVEPGPSGDAIFLLWIDRRESEKGTGAKVIECLCEVADAHGTMIVLQAMGQDPRLIAYYEGFGFALSGRTDLPDPIMRRMATSPLPHP